MRGDAGDAGDGIRPWLVVIDPQVIFASPESPWGSPMFAAIVPRVRALATAFAGRVVVTRFVAPAEPQGSWRAYYVQWPFARVEDSDPLYAVVPELASLAAAAHVVTEPTFGKWGAALREIVGATPRLVLTGVSTDCCVIATALAAADAGAAVTVVSDACAGSTPDNHAAALQVLSLYEPQITLTTTAELLA
ncbi:isochorismatase family protein [Arsenicicoccus sp. MKL-02]|uniref:Isochorismatase family protein n=1 Tax=Arsenicicoccus cauae TaxID=2663847 RepID=A0A6I3IDU2_9MICO|nr:isochorismatase family protein [Arsenicicoccus cauae]MTB70823.1 isochorismatase family protein [Arsenicicoccus cauae]